MSTFRFIKVCVKIMFFIIYQKRKTNFPRFLFFINPSKKGKLNINFYCTVKIFTTELNHICQSHFALFFAILINYRNVWNQVAYSFN